jgi:8-oxo-dGTP pyrophosphatase MutT (NUDIX family)
MARLSASLVVLRRSAGSAPFDYTVLLVQRSRKMKFATSVWVFPGGVHEACDGVPSSPKAKAEAMRTTALRETFEEVGLLPTTRRATLPAPEWKQWRQRVHADASQWSQFLSADMDRLGSVRAFCCFLTPEFERQRSGRQYETHFMVAEASAQDASDPSTLVDVDDNETARALWLDPAAALERNRAGELPLFPPQFYILSHLVSCPRLDDALQLRSNSPRHALRLQPEGALAPVLQPELVTDGEDAVLVLPYDAQHSTAGQAGWRHRVTGFMRGQMGLQLDAGPVQRLTAPNAAL